MHNLHLSAARNMSVLMVDSVDHVTGKTGLTPSVELSKNGGAFASIAPVIAEMAYGFYRVELTASHTDTEGDLVLHITAAGADPADVLAHVGSVSADVTKVNSITVAGSGVVDDEWGPA